MLLTHTTIALAMLACGAALAEAEPNTGAEPDTNISIAEQPITDQDACELGQDLASKQRSDTLALLYLERCHRKTPSRETRQVMHEVRERIRKSMSKAAPVSLALTPETAHATLIVTNVPSDYARLDLRTEDELWLHQGRYELEVMAEGFEGGRFAIEVDSTDRMLIPITLKPESGTNQTSIDMTAERGAELGQVASAADPRPKKFKTLLAKRYQRAPTPTPLPSVRDERGAGPLPYLALSLGTVAIGTGVVFHARDSTGPALAGYGAGALLGGIATYLFLRPTEPPPQALSLGVVRGGAVLTLAGSL